MYYPTTKLPPGRREAHRVVVVSPDALLKTNRNLFVMLVIIRSARDERTNGPRPLVPGHSIPISHQQYSFLKHDSIIETHQLFAMPLPELMQQRALGRLLPDTLEEVLDSLQRLFS